MQLRVFPILDDWIQESHKRKTIDAGNSKEGDKVTEELLLMLLHFLDRLPIDIDVLNV